MKKKAQNNMNICRLVTEKEKKGRNELWKKVIKTKERKRKISEIKQKIQNNLNVHRLVTEKKKMLAKKNVQGLFGQLTIVNFSPQFSPHFGERTFWLTQGKNT